MRIRIALSFVALAGLTVVHSALVFMYERLGDAAHADQAYRLSFKFVDTDSRNWEMYSNFLLRQGKTADYKRARARYEETKNYWQKGIESI